MDADQFDALAARLTTMLSRRRSLAVFGAAGLATAALAADADGKGKKKKRKKRKKPATTPAPPAPTCSDGIRNGSETGIDCGGTCPRCANGQTCQGPADCASAHCVGGSCATCAFDADCAAAGAPCRCNIATGNCYNTAGGRDILGTCADCPAGTAVSADKVTYCECFPRCGEVFPA